MFLEKFFTWVFLNIMLWVVVGICYLLICLIGMTWYPIWEHPILIRAFAVFIALGALQMTQETI